MKRKHPIQTPEAEALGDALERLYAVFMRYPLDPKMEACAHCVSAAEVARLSSVPLRQLSADDLQRYSFKAITTWGTVLDFKHFLPRLIELCAQGDIVHGVDSTRNNLLHADWETWPQDERVAIIEFLRAAWPMQTRRYYDDAEKWHETLVALGEDGFPFLRSWLQSADADAQREFAHWISSGQWKCMTEDVQEWVLSPEVAARLEQLYLHEPPHQYAEEIARAFDTLEYWRTVQQSIRS